jgi:hypothetical protein
MAAMRGLIPTMLETRIRLLFSGVAKPLLRCMSPVVGTFRTWRDVRLESGMRSKADVRAPIRIHGCTP